ncbi:hypothetical protein [Streptomyces bauhiniae]|uniref:hypothetical protein n=1 Tax=Streptomyces bauhiniae TaxID=2340725 RepID=UPI00381A6938
MPPEPWPEHLINPQGLRAIYGIASPPLTAVRLRRLTLHEDGPALTLHGFGAEITADVVLTAAGDGVAVRVTAPATTVETVARTAHLARLTAYAQE